MIKYKIWLNKGLNIARERINTNHIRIERIFRNGKFVGSKRGYGSTALFLLERAHFNNEKNKKLK